MTVMRVPSNYWGEIKPGSTASAAQSDVAYEAKQRLRELFYSEVERYGRVAVEKSRDKVERLKRQREQRFGPDDDARRIGQAPNSTVSGWMGYALIAGVLLAGYWLWRRA